MRNFKTNKGITLVALVITIIILIILAGVTISLVMGDNGIATKARMGAQNYQNASEEERVLINTLLDNVTETNPTPPVTVEWKFATGGDKDSSGTITAGDLVQPKNSTLANEKFWVIKVGTGADPVVTLLAEKCVKVSSGEGQYTQMDNAGTLAFGSSKVYYTNPTTYSSICGEVNNYVARFTGAGMHLQEVTNEAGTGTISGLYGRLLWGTNSSGEIQEVITLSSTIAYGPEGKKLKYWLGSPREGSAYDVWSVDGSGGYVSNFRFYDDSYYGVRPVLEVLMSNF